MPPGWDECVFINCPFDEQYDPILQAILFCICLSGKTPRLATERNDGGEARIAKIIELISACRYSIHDLSRCQSRKKGELARLNMPFELGIDFGFRQFGGERAGEKRILILEEKKYRYQAAISDLAGSDIQAHDGKFELAIREVRNWLVSAAKVRLEGSAAVIAAYATFQGWHVEKKRALGHSEEDILRYVTSELLDDMREWIDLGRPDSFFP